MSVLNKTVFISYAHEDADSCERLRKELTNVGLTVSRDKDDILPGEKWEIKIRKLIRSSRYFIPLFSTKWVDRAAYVQKEIKYAIDNYDIYPESEISIIPARLDNCKIPFEKLGKIEYVDLFPNWESGFQRILRAMKIDTAQTLVPSEKEKWQMGLSDKDWKDLLISICKKKCIPFIGAGTCAVQAENGKTFIPLNKHIIEKWKEKHRDPLEDRQSTSQDDLSIIDLLQFISSSIQMVRIL